MTAKQRDEAHLNETYLHEVNSILNQYFEVDTAMMKPKKKLEALLNVLIGRKFELESSLGASTEVEVFYQLKDVHLKLVANAAWEVRRNISCEVLGNVYQTMPTEDCPLEAWRWEIRDPVHISIERSYPSRDEATLGLLRVLKAPTEQSPVAKSDERQRIEQHIKSVSSLRELYDVLKDLQPQRHTIHVCEATPNSGIWLVMTDTGKKIGTVHEMPVGFAATTETNPDKALPYNYPTIYNTFQEAIVTVCNMWEENKIERKPLDNYVDYNALKPYQKPPIDTFTAMANKIKGYIKIMTSDKEMYDFIKQTMWNVVQYASRLSRKLPVVHADHVMSMIDFELGMVEEIEYNPYTMPDIEDRRDKEIAELKEEVKALKEKIKRMPTKKGNGMFTIGRAMILLSMGDKVTRQGAEDYYISMLYINGAGGNGDALNTLLLHNVETGKAESYLPSMDDLTATDWKLYEEKSAEPKPVSELLNEVVSSLAPAHTAKIPTPRKFKRREKLQELAGKGDDYEESLEWLSNRRKEGNSKKSKDGAYLPGIYRAGWGNETAVVHMKPKYQKDNGLYINSGVTGESSTKYIPSDEDKKANDWLGVDNWRKHAKGQEQITGLTLDQAMFHAQEDAACVAREVWQNNNHFVHYVRYVDHYSKDGDVLMKISMGGSDMRPYDASERSNDWMIVKPVPAYMYNELQEALHNGYSIARRSWNDKAFVKTHKGAELIYTEPEETKLGGNEWGCELYKIDAKDRNAADWYVLGKFIPYEEVEQLLPHGIKARRLHWREGEYIYYPGNDKMEPGAILRQKYTGDVLRYEPTKDDEKALNWHIVVDFGEEKVQWPTDPDFKDFENEEEE